MVGHDTALVGELTVIGSDTRIALIKVMNRTIGWGGIA